MKIIGSGLVSQISSHLCLIIFYLKFLARIEEEKTCFDFLLSVLFTFFFFSALRGFLFQVSSVFHPRYLPRMHGGKSSLENMLWN